MHLMCKTVTQKAKNLHGWIDLIVTVGSCQKEKKTNAEFGNLTWISPDPTMQKGYSAKLNTNLQIIESHFCQ